MRKANFCYEQNQKKESMANWKAKKNNNHYDQKKKEFVPNQNSKSNKARNFPNKNFQAIRSIQRVKSLLIIMEITQRILNAKNL